MPYDWAGFFKTRIEDVAPRAPLAGIENGGWKLVYTDVEPELTKAGEEESKLYDFWYSLGMMVQGEAGEDGAEEGTIRDVVPGMPAAARASRRGCGWSRSTGGGTPRRGCAMRSGRAKGCSEPIELLVENVETFKTFKVDYHGGRDVPAPRAGRVPARPRLRDRQPDELAGEEAVGGKLIRP